jgi:hypothetical protein
MPRSPDFTPLHPATIARNELVAGSRRPRQMRSSLVLSVVLALLTVLGLTPGRATDSHEYEKDEYAIIRGGMSPDRHLSLASHGDGLGGSENFHVWLMAEPAHRKIMALDDISSDNNLDTGPDAYHATWAPDSRHVAVNFRSDRHVLELNLYGIENRRARLVSGPSVFRDVTSRDAGRKDDHVRASVSEIEWSSSRRFVLREYHLFLTSDPGFARMLGRYGKAKDKVDDGRTFFAFSAEADCVLMPGNRYRIVDLRVGKFPEYR